MLAAYIAVTVVAAIANACAAVLSFTHHKSVVETAERLRVPVSWTVPLGFLLAAGSLGLVAGFAIPALGTAAACGLVLYFLFAAGAHIRARDTRLLAGMGRVLHTGRGRTGDGSGLPRSLMKAPTASSRSNCGSG